MFVLTAKISKGKLIASAVLLLAAILLIVLLSSGTGSTSQAPVGTSNDDRIAYLATHGWSVNTKASEMQKVRIPNSSDNRVFARYNDLQKSQGFDLTNYAGQEVMRYVYEILNYPDADSPVYATVLVADGKIIGGDVTNSSDDGVIHGFKRPNTEPVTEPSTEPTTQPAEVAEPTEVHD